MQRISRAPVLSATLRRVSCWIISSLLCFLDDFGQAPALGLRQRPRLDDPDDVADPGRVLLVVGVQAAARPDDLLVLAVGTDHLDLDHDRLVALVRDDDSPALLAPPGRRLRLR